MRRKRKLKTKRARTYCKHCKKQIDYSKSNLKKTYCSTKCAVKARNKGKRGEENV